jgi:hypothetical protein
MLFVLFLASNAVLMVAVGGEGVFDEDVEEEEAADEEVSMR